MSINDRLDEIQERANQATDGPWAPWLDQDGADHMQGLLMVGNADAVIPEGEWWVEGVDVNPIAHTYCEEDRAFIAHARTDVPALLAALRAVLAIDIGENRSVYGIDFEAGMCKALAIVHKTIDTHLGEGS